MYISDFHRNGRQNSYVTRFLFWFRLAQTTRFRILNIIARIFMRHYYKMYGLEIPWNTKIGEGLYLGHAFNITINGKAVIGRNCNIHKGVTIGQANRGKYKGMPTIGNEVWIGINATVVGKITIGDDVMIAPNSFVNRDVPSHSVVFGNPCTIMHRDCATEGYINNKV